MAMIHINRSGTTLGIFEEEKVREGLDTGEFIGTDLGWTDGMSAWRPLSELESFRAPASAAVPPQIPPASPVAAQPVISSTMPATIGAPRKTEPLAIISFVLSIVGLLCCAFVFGIPAVVCGHLVLGKIRKDPQLQGHGLAVAGLIIGYFGMACWLIYILFFGGVAVLEGITEGLSR